MQGRGGLVGPLRTCAPGIRAISSSAEGGEVSRDEIMVQYVLVRRDLQSVLGWPLGSVVAQVVGVYMYRYVIIYNIYIYTGTYIHKCICI